MVWFTLLIETSKKSIETPDLVGFFIIAFVISIAAFAFKVLISKTSKNIYGKQPQDNWVRHIGLKKKKVILSIQLIWVEKNNIFCSLR